MKKFSRFLLACVVILAALGTFFAVKNRDSLSKIEMPEIEIINKKDKVESTVVFSDIEGAKTTKVSMVSVAQVDDFYNINAEYPQIESAGKEFNEKIYLLIKSKIDEFKNESRANWQARLATMPEGEAKPETPDQPFDFIAAWDLMRLGPRYAGFTIEIYYFAGGAHGISEIYAFNYDLGGEKEITIADFLGSDEELQKLAAMANEKAAEQLKIAGLEQNDILDEMISSGTAPEASNYRNFVFGGNVLKIYFEKYQVAPGSAGTIVLEFYKNELEQNEIFSDYFN